MHSDVVSAARALMAVPKPLQKGLCARLFRQADWADRYTRRLGKPHPYWGNGTLLGAAQMYRRVPEPTFNDHAYCTAFELVLAQLCARRGRGGL